MGGGILNATIKQPILKAPFPYPGGKSKVASMVWDRFGDVDNFIEPFCGTMAVLLKRPAEHFRSGYRTETVNDANHYLVNFWRAVKHDPEVVAYHADWPVMEADLHARHRWLVRSEEVKEWRNLLTQDPEHYNAKIAGYWVWGQCSWIGGGWCNDIRNDYEQMPQLDVNHGVNLGGRPQLADAFDIGRGVNAGGSEHLKRPCFPDSQSPIRGVCGVRRQWLIDWMRRLSDRLRLVRTCYGHWSRICDSDSTPTRLGTCGVFLDPPYPTERGDNSKKSRDGSLYINDKTQCLNALRDEVLAWCRKWSGPQIRIAVCGYEGDGYEALEQEGWAVESWETNGGYSNQRKKKGQGKGENAKRERIWFNPASVKPSGSLLDLIAED